MPNIRSQSVDDTGITIVASNGKTFSITPAAILIQQAVFVGTKSLTTSWIADQIETTLGVDMVPAVSVTIDYDAVTGIPFQLDIVDPATVQVV